MYSPTDLLRDARVIHVYVSAFLFTLLIFFSLTGLFLNHPEWFEVNNRSDFVEASLPAEQMHLLQGSQGENWQPDMQSLLDHFRNQYGLGAPDSMGWERSFNEASFEFTAPGGYAQIYLDTLDGSYELISESAGVIEILNDLHKGRHSGIFWSWVIDLCAVFMVVFAVSGILLLTNSIRFRNLAFVLVGLGTLAPVLIVFFWVPAI